VVWDVPLLDQQSLRLAFSYPSGFIDGIKNISALFRSSVNMEVISGSESGYANSESQEIQNGQFLIAGSSPTRGRKKLTHQIRNKYIGILTPSGSFPP